MRTCVRAANFLTPLGGGTGEAASPGLIVSQVVMRRAAVAMNAGSIRRVVRGAGGRPFVAARERIVGPRNMILASRHAPEMSVGQILSPRETACAVAHQLSLSLQIVCELPHGGNAE